MSITESIRRFEREFAARAEKFIWKHPFMGLLAVFVGLPVFILICVCISTVVISFPVAWLLSGCNL